MHNRALVYHPSGLRMPYCGSKYLLGSPLNVETRFISASTPPQYRLSVPRACSMTSTSGPLAAPLHYEYKALRSIGTRLCNAYPLTSMTPNLDNQIFPGVLAVNFRATSVVHPFAFFVLCTDASCLVKSLGTCLIIYPASSAGGVVCLSFVSQSARHELHLRIALPKLLYSSLITSFHPTFSLRLPVQFPLVGFELIMLEYKSIALPLAHDHP